VGLIGKTAVRRDRCKGLAAARNLSRRPRRHLLQAIALRRHAVSEAETAAAFAAETQRLDDKAHIHGLINADVSLACTRCLEPIAKHLEIPFHAVFVDANEEDPNAEAEIADDLLDESLVEDGSINVADVVREQILLATPEQVFCDPGCKGLCPQCGANLNLIDCKCADDDIDPRWAALKSLK